MLSHNVESLLSQRYYQLGETWESLVTRVVDNICKNEPPGFKHTIYEQIKDRIWLPNSPCLVNTGLSNGGIFACFTVGPDEDTLEHHVEVLGDIAAVGKRGGGAGFSGAAFRAKGSLVSGSAHGYAYGPNWWATQVSNYLDGITQGGFRKMALMYSLPADHPDIIDFIKLKHNGNERFGYNFNQSVFATDEWMQYATVKHSVQSGILNSIVDHAHANGEPGLLFDTRINTDTPYTNCGCKIKTTNPCQPGFATLLTPDGIKTLDNVDVGSIIWTGDKWTKVSNKWYTGVKSVYRFISSGGEFVGTESHKVFEHGERVEARYAESLDIIAGQINPALKTHRRAIMDGLVIGDGSVHKASGNLVHLHIGKNDWDYFNSEIKDFLLKDRTIAFSNSPTALAYEIETTITAKELPLTYDRHIPDRYFFADSDVKKSFLRGLFSANGSVVANGRRVTLKATSHAVVSGAQKMLSSIGIRSYITINKPSVVEWLNGTYESRQSYDLNITQDRYEFLAEIAFIQGYKNEKISGDVAKRAFTATMQTVEYLGDFPVYDITVEDDAHSYWTGGVCVSNCGEQPLPSYGSCNLASININHPMFYNNSNNFNFVALASVVSSMTRFLDNVGSVNIFPNDKFKNWYEKHRPIGIGVMGFADALLRLGHAYGEQDSLDFISNVMEVIQGESYRMSEKLGQERGIPEHCRAVNRRNITTVSIAPTGSIALLAECSHGIEPIFSPKFQRTDERGETYIFEHPLRDKNHFRSALNEDKDKIPTWKQHIDIQATAQRHVDAGVSKTINLLNGVSKQDVYDAMVYAWKQRTKGITIYRDGSRDVQVLEDIKEEDSLLQDCPSGACDL